MMARHARVGRVDAIFVRSERRSDVLARHKVAVGFDGLAGDHAREGKRAVTLIQAEHLPVISGLIGREAITPALLRRNLVVSGINLLALRNQDVLVGTARLRVTGPCPPCSRMEEVLGFGGYSAMRGHGGVYAEVLVEGGVAIGDFVGRPDAT